VVHLWADSVVQPAQGTAAFCHGLLVSDAGCAVVKLSCDILLMLDRDVTTLYWVVPTNDHNATMPSLYKVMTA
jgi:hypothetical protein